MTFGVCPWEKVWFSQKNVYRGMLVQYALHGPGVWGLLLFDKKMGGNEVAIAHEWRELAQCLLMNIWRSGVLFVVFLGFWPTGHG